MGPAYLIGFTVGKNCVPEPGAGKAGAAASLAADAGANEVMAVGMRSSLASGVSDNRKKRSLTHPLGVCYE